MNNPFKKAVAGDAAPSSRGDQLRRLCLAALYLTGGLVPVLAVLARIQPDGRWFLPACGSAALCLSLLLTRRRWRSGVATPTQESARKAASFFARVSALLPLVKSTAPGRAASLSGEPRPRILLLNASLAGPQGNSAKLLAKMERQLAPHAEIILAELAGPDAATFARLEPALRVADALVIATGTHWDSWSSPLQRFLEDATPAEATKLWLGKPAAVLVTEHSAGGKGVLSRLQGVLVTLGCVIPPLSGLVISKAVQLAREGGARAATRDFWSPEDMEVVAHNLLVAARQSRANWKAWPVDRTDYSRVWLDGGRA